MRQAVDDRNDDIAPVNAARRRVDAADAAGRGAIRGAVFGLVVPSGVVDPLRVALVLPR